MSGEWSFEFDGTQVTVTKNPQQVEVHPQQDMYKVRCGDLVSHWPVAVDVPADKIAEAVAETTYRTWLERGGAYKQLQPADFNPEPTDRQRELIQSLPSGSIEISGTLETESHPEYDP